MSRLQLVLTALAAVCLCSCGSAPPSQPPAGNMNPPAPAINSGPAPAETAAAEDDEAIPAAVADSVRAALVAAIDGRVTPGGVAVVGRDSGERTVIPSGRTDHTPGAPAVTDTTLFDLASLTKVVGTTTAIMVLVDRGTMELDAPLSRYLPVWPTGGWRDEVTIRRLLTHRSGLPPFIRFWHPSAGALRGPDAILGAIVRLEPDYRPGTRRVYSDLGFILLGAAVEAVTGEGLDTFLATEVWQPLGMEETGFNPRPERMVEVRREGGLPSAGRDLVPLDRIAPTEVDTVYRHVHVHGVVHDENAYALGGVAGHAGLFSTAADLGRYARMLLGGGRLGDVQIVRPETLRQFTAPHADGRALGWESRTDRNLGAPFTEAAFGHTGFTGTSLWVDPRLDLFVLLLTNRVNPTREGSGIMDLRRTVHRLAADAVADAGGGWNEQ